MLQTPHGHYRQTFALASEAPAVSQSGCGDSKAGGAAVVTVTLVSVEPPLPPPQADKTANTRRLEKF